MFFYKVKGDMTQTILYAVQCLILRTFLITGWYKNSLTLWPWNLNPVEKPVENHCLIRILDSSVLFLGIEVLRWKQRFLLSSFCVLALGLYSLLKDVSPFRVEKMKG